MNAAVEATFKDAAFAALDHAGKEEAGERGKGDDIELHHAAVCFPIALVEFSVAAEAGVVDQNIY